MARRSGAFQRLADNLAQLSVVPSRCSKSVAATLTVHLNDEFARGADPYGTPWVPLAPATVARKGHREVMYLTGRTARETRAVAASGAGVDLITTDYMRWHHGYRSVLPDRPELPLVWQRAIADAVDEEFRRALER